MKKKLILLIAPLLALEGALLINTAAPSASGLITANAGTRFEQVGPDHLVRGVAQVSLLGDCTFESDLAIVGQPSPSQMEVAGPFKLSSKNGVDVLEGEWAGTVTLEAPPSPFAALSYSVVFTGGRGRFENARGSAMVAGFAMTTALRLPDGTMMGECENPAAFFCGTATWTMTGHVFTEGRALGTDPGTISGLTPKGQPRPTGNLDGQ